MRIASVQLEVGSDPAKNRDLAEGRIRDAVSDGADFVVLPEIWNVGYFAFDRYESEAEPIDGETVQRLRTLADELDVHLHGGSIVERDGDDLFNTSLLFGPDGSLLDTYRKVHLFGYDSQESKLLTPGDRVVAVETELATVGLTTCYDLRFPELYRALVDRGIELLLVTSAWPNARTDHWELLSRTRALENQVFLAAANLAGENEGVEMAGRSTIVDPWGVPIANAGTGSRTAIADIDLDTVEEIRDEFPALHDRRMTVTYDL